MTTVEQAFLAMKYVKTEICSKMDDDFIVDCLTLHIEWEFTMNLDLDYIIAEFYVVKYCWIITVIDDILWLYCYI